MNFQISRNGQMYGPYTLDDLQRYVASGNVLLTDMAKSEEMTEWAPVSDVLSTRRGGAPGSPGAGTPGAAGGFSSPGFANPSFSDPANSGQGYANPGYANPAAGQPGIGNPGFTVPGYMPQSASAAQIAASPYPDAPNLNWGLVLLFCVLSCGLFMPIWNIVVAAWLRKVQPNANSLFFYIGGLVLAFVQVAISFGNQFSNLHAADPSTGISPALSGYTTTAGIIGLVVGLVTWVVRLIARFSQKASLEEHFNGPEPIGLQLNPVMVFFFGGLYFQYHLNRVNAMKQAARFGAGRQAY